MAKTLNVSNLKKVMKVFDIRFETPEVHFVNKRTREKLDYEKLDKFGNKELEAYVLADNAVEAQEKIINYYKNIDNLKINEYNNEEYYIDYGTIYKLVYLNITIKEIVL